MINVSKFVESLEGKPVAVLGLGISNTAAIKALVKAGATVAAWDDSAAHHENAGEHLVDLNNQDMAQYACLVVAPAIPLELPERTRKWSSQNTAHSRSSLKLSVRLSMKILTSYHASMCSPEASTRGPFHPTRSTTPLNLRAAI